MTRHPARRHALLLLLVALVALLAPALAAAPTSFCKCVCFGNSSIVALDAPVKADKPPAPVLLGEREEREEPGSRKKTCNDCNRQFCLSYPFCKGEKEEKVVSTCFQRDSAKDQAVVYSFIIATVGLLGYAAARPWINRARERHNYIPVAGQGNQ